MNGPSTLSAMYQEVRIPAGRVSLTGDLHVPHNAHGIVLFAHGSGSGRHSPRNRLVAELLQSRGMATLLFDLLTPEEERIDRHTAELRFNIPLLAERLIQATDWIDQQRETATLSVGYFGASTGGGAALVAAAERPERVKAVVSRGGRPDLAGEALSRVQSATLLIVGGSDQVVIELNRQALEQLAAPQKQLAIVPGATHLFEEPGKLAEVANLAGAWFDEHLA